MTKKKNIITRPVFLGVGYRVFRNKSGINGTLF